MKRPTSMEALRAKMIRETQEYLNAHLTPTTTPRPADPPEKIFPDQPPTQIRIDSFLFPTADPTPAPCKQTGT